MMKSIALALCMGLGGGGQSCLGRDAAQPMSPDEVLAGALPDGEELTVRGRVLSLSFRSRFARADDSELLPGRLVLFRPDAVQGEPTDWSLGAALPAAEIDSRRYRLPQAGDLVEVRGRIGTISWHESERRLLDSVSAFRIVEAAAPALRDLGESCTQDMDCTDDLWCERRGVCGRPPALTWDSSERNIHGTCRRDEDCPTGQRCDPRYSVAEAGEYRPPYFASRDVGRNLCQVDRAAPPEVICRRTATVHDLLGGRFPQGKEVCVRTTIAYVVLSPGDRDTHVQARIPAPDLFPETSPALDPFGASLENVPPYKDPLNPAGAVMDPRAGQQVDVLGTVHYDTGHGWWEIHPIKWLRPAPPASSASR